MTAQKNKVPYLLLVLSAVLLAVSLTAAFLYCYYTEKQFELLGTFCSELIKAKPDAEETILNLLKEKTLPGREAENFLGTFGYRASDFSRGNGKAFFAAGLGILAAGLLYLFTVWYWHKKLTSRVKMLTNYLEKINTGSPGVLLASAEDEFSKLQDEIYKTVTALYQTRDAAVEEKNNFAENLSNIAHQVKTPITAISLSVQMMKDKPREEYLSQIEKQSNRLTNLEEALLLLSRIDAGKLPLQRTSADVFTLLMLAADNLEELSRQSGVLIDIPEMGEITVNVDLDWTMEAVMNLLKNCMEHSAPGTAVHCTCEKNPLYVRLRIWDEGEGFAREDIPHLFERFYRGKNAKAGSIGIGLSIAKEIIERQNGVLSAENLTGGGACFEIRLYSH